MTPTAPPVSYRHLRHQLPNMLAMAGGGLRSVLPTGKGAAAKPLQQRMKAPPPHLLDAYHRWSGMDVARYGGCIAPHFAAGQMGLRMISQLTAQSPYPLLSVVNQGVHIVVNEALPRDGSFRLAGRLMDASDDSYRARIHSQVRISSESVEDAVIIDAYAAVMLRARTNRKAKKERPVPFTTVGHWQAAANEGVRFFKLTGDFNPLHTLPLLARRTRYGGCIMHGYGSFAQLFEAIRRAGWDIAEIDTRFVRAVPLPSPELLIQVADTADAQGRRLVRMVDAESNIYQAGSFLPTAETA
ncbi:MaoC family dehydratase [Algiphilus sp.]|uniref:MaoC family dehydratase n=1 Tax=Algiphilus sp. TaxID=1872431 RepID=UPI003B525AA6